jgi:hypothetical protein
MVFMQQSATDPCPSDGKGNPLLAACFLRLFRGDALG